MDGEADAAAGEVKDLGRCVGEGCRERLRWVPILIPIMGETL